ncbi:MAG: hypothetical protein K2X35_05760 [Bryobacteraceae bacterium]|nr:hypothetical protein [Bryobacteraceae bacterium]
MDNLTPDHKRASLNRREGNPRVIGERLAGFFFTRAFLDIEMKERLVSFLAAAVEAHNRLRSHFDKG